uniref:NADH-ubiquinone oxidoreductase chain 3 n=1 Tax=Triaenodes qinglingensis TaxID=2904906 RepID=A0A9E8LPE5_9NEOP|nr:NADH dehydrogenase subunit 3 [Triaenodes qinglingensis]UZZ44435.1 NADH dehydrogenase subunit 3 [Triaenodes qinglingensis]
MYMLMMLVIASLTLSILLKIIMILVSKKLIKTTEKMSPFECGFTPINNNRISFSIHFFLISIIFLIFDVEITLIIPMILTFLKSNMLKWYLTCLYFFILLLFSLYFEWKIQMLNWTN